MKSYFEKLTKEQKEIWYYEKIYDSLLLFSLEPKVLMNLEASLFNPLGELEACYFEFKNNYNEIRILEKVIEAKAIQSINSFICLVDNIDDEEWDFNYMILNLNWKNIRIAADEILNLLGEYKNREFEKHFKLLPKR